MKKVFWILVLTVNCQLSTVKRLFATPSTQIWNPSTDIQALKTFHLGIDNYFSIAENKDKPYALGTDVGLTFGLFKNMEIGIDAVQPSADPVYLNAKYGFAQSDVLPAFAVGGCSFGTKKDVTDYNILYAVTARTFKPVGRFSVGYYSGNESLLIDENGDKSNTGVILTWDKTVSGKVWLSVDYASGRSFYGSLTPGFSYLFAPNTSIIFGYVIYNNDKVNRNNQFTTQLDINF